MATVFCDNCGTSILENAKFCRACGKPTPSLSEATTRKFDEPFHEQPGIHNPTRSVGPSFTAPAYMSPSEFNPTAPGVETNDLRQKTRKRNLIIIGSMFAVMIFALAGLLIFLSLGVSGPHIPTPPTVVVPQTPTPPTPPGQPPPPPITTEPVRSGIDPSLIYPGSRQTMSVEHDGGKSVLQLMSDDSARTVADWYSARLKSAKTVHVIGQTILKAGDIGVVIIGGENGSQILITKGDD